MPFGFRPDADLVRDLSLTRRIMPFLMPTRNESAVYFEMFVNAQNIKPFLDDERARTGKKITLLHLFALVAARTFRDRPRLNRFVTGGRVWQRRGIWISFSAKRQKSDDGAVVALKKKIDPEWDLTRVCEAIDGDVGDARANKLSSSDKELKLIFLLPLFLVSAFIAFARLLNHFGLMPRAMIDSDPLFASLFVANVGSIGMDAPFHHLYEWGNIPLFCAMGKEQDGKIPLRFTFDERVEDGFYCLKAIELLKQRLEEPALFLLDKPAPDRDAPSGQTPREATPSAART